MVFDALGELGELEGVALADELAVGLGFETFLSDLPALVVEKAV